MAFNPFSVFREHKKGALVALTILTMIIFIGQFGAGDPIGKVMGLLGAGRASGEVVTTLYGKKVRESDINKLARNRKLASDFLYRVVFAGHAEVAKELAKVVEKPGEGSALLGVKEMLTLYQRTPMTLFQELSQVGGDQAQENQILDRFGRQIDSVLRQIEAIGQRKEIQDSDRVLLQKVATLLGFQGAILHRRDGVIAFLRRLSPSDPAYFGGSLKTPDLLDFRLWQIQADRLGIKLTDEDVLKEVIAETAGASLLNTKLSFDEQPQVEEFLRPLRRDKAVTSPSDLLDALREEFRVVIAQSMLLGSQPGVRAYRNALGAANTPSLATPDEFLHYFREQRAALRVKLYPITAASFLDKVKGAPSESELLTRYKRGDKQESSPSTREPGFMLPRRIAVEYVVASPEDAFYKELGRKDAAMLGKLSDARLRVGDVAISLTAPGLAKVIPLALDPLYSDFAKALRDNPDQAMRGRSPELGADFVWFHFQLNPISDEIMRGRLHFTSVIEPASIASTLSGMQGGPLTGLTSLITTATREELRKSIPFNLSMMLAQANPQQLFGAAGLAVQTLPLAMSPTLLEPQIVAAREKSLADEALGNKLTIMKAELAKLGKKPAAARAYIDKAVKDYHLHVYTMPSAETLEGLIADLKAKKKPNLDLLRKSMGMDEDKQDTLRRFASNLFRSTGEYVPEFAGMIPDTKQVVLAWHSQEKKAEERSFDRVRDEVVAAWRLEKARALARDEAERLEAEVNKKKVNAADAERYLNEQKTGTPFELDNISQMVRPAREVHGNPTIDYTLYRVPEDKSELFPYPPMDLTKQLMKLTRRGEATVIVDRPAKTYYLALLVDRTEPDLLDFKNVYAMAARNDPMYRFFQGQRNFDYRKSVMEQLRREAAGELDKDGRFKLSDTVRNQDSNSADGE